MFGRVCGLLFAALLTASTAACGRAGAPSASANSALHGETLVILASDDLKNLDFLLPGMEAVLRHKVRFEYVRAAEMVDRINAADAISALDFVWPSSSIYLNDLDAGKILQSESIARSPLVLGLKHERAEELGWDKHAPSWSEIMQVAKREEGLNLGMANPAASDLGLLTLLSGAAAFEGKSEVLDANDLGSPKLQMLYSKARMLGGGASWLSDVYSKEEDRLDGIVTYESSVLALNATPDALDDPLSVVHLRDGSVHADFPMMLLNPARRSEYQRLVAFLRSRDTQRAIMEKTFRRSIDPQLPLVAGLNHDRPEPLNVLPKANMLESMLDGFNDKVRPPAHVYFLLDVSGSMSEDHRIDELKAGLGVLVGSDQTQFAGREARFHQRERVDMLSFDSHLRPGVSLDFSEPTYAASTQQFQSYVNGLQPLGGTAVYDALQATYEKALKDRKKQPGYTASIVLISDGHNASGQNFEAFREWLQSLPDTSQDIRVYPILYGDVEDHEMKELAALTHGRVFDATGVGLGETLERARGFE